MRPFRQLSGLACLSAMLLSGCESTPSSVSVSAPSIIPAPYSRIGIITQLDLNSATVVVRMDREDTPLNTEVLVRNKRRNIVSVLQPTGLRTGNSVGMVILSGNPVVGQEVVQKIQP